MHVKKRADICDWTRIYTKSKVGEERTQKCCEWFDVLQTISNSPTLQVRFASQSKIEHDEYPDNELKRKYLLDSILWWNLQRNRKSILNNSQSLHSRNLCTPNLEKHFTQTSVCLLLLICWHINTSKINKKSFVPRWLSFKTITKKWNFAKKFLQNKDA